MQQQIRTQTPKKNKPAASLIISWLIILGVYLLLRLVFVIFGFHLAPVVLGGFFASIGSAAPNATCTGNANNVSPSY